MKETDFGSWICEAALYMMLASGFLLMSAGVLMLTGAIFDVLGTTKESICMNQSRFVDINF